MKHYDTQLKFRGSQWRNQEFYDSFAIRLLDGELEIGGPSSECRQGQKFFSSVQRPGPLCGRSTFLIMGTWESFPTDTKVMNLITYFSVTPKVKHNWSFASTLHTSSYRGAQLMNMTSYASNLLATFRHRTAVPSSTVRQSKYPWTAGQLKMGPTDSPKTSVTTTEPRRVTSRKNKTQAYHSSCLHRASMIIKHCVTQLMHNIKYVDTIKIIKYLKVLQHVSDHRGSIIREPCTALG